MCAEYISLTDARVDSKNYEKNVQFTVKPQKRLNHHCTIAQDQQQHIDDNCGNAQEKILEAFKILKPSCDDCDVLELLLSMTCPEIHAELTAKRLLMNFGSFTRVINASIESLAWIGGLDTTAICALKLVHEATIRSLRPVPDSIILASAEEVLKYCYVSMSHQEHEQFRILYLNSKNRLIKDELQQYGTIDAVPLYCREIMKTAMNIGATGLIMAHNHPSGDPTPSRADVRCTYEIFQAASALRISLHDHLIVAKNTHFSFRANKILGRAPPAE